MKKGLYFITVVFLFTACNFYEKKEAVAKVATTIFGAKYGIDQIIREYLDTCTSGKQFNAIELRNALIKGIDETADEREFINHPVTNWIELNIALQVNNGVLERGKPKTFKNIAQQLKDITELD